MTSTNNNNNNNNSSYYTGCYPAGAFLVSDARHLGPLVSELRRAQLLKKSTRNVTNFDPAYALVLSEEEEDVAIKAAVEGDGARLRLQHHQLYISKAQPIKEAAAAAAAAAATPQKGTAASMDDIACLQAHIATEVDVLRAQEEILPLVTLNQTEEEVAQLLSRCSHATTMTDEGPTRYMAVHVTGALTPECVAQYLAGAYLPPASRAKKGAQPPVAFVYFLRAYSRPCYTAADLARLPPSHQQLVQAGTQPRGPAPPPAGSFSFTELFGGIGMFRAGLEAAGGTAALAVEMALPAVTVYDANFPPGVAAGLLWAGDLTELPSYLLPRYHSLLSAGFPCQSFAKAGPALGLQMQHGQLFYEVVRALRACQPASFLLENVANLVEVEEGRQLAEILRWLRCPLTGETEPEAAAPLYEVQYRVLDGGCASPQVRRRVYFVGVRRDVPPQAEEEEARGACLQEVFRRAEEKLQSLSSAVASSGAGLATVSIPFSCTDAPEGTGASPTHVLYGTVRDVLLSSHAWQPSSSCAAAAAVASCYTALADYLRTLHLSPSQSDTLARTQSFRQHPSWRVADLGGKARTLMGSYRTSYQRYSEFVPVEGVKDEAEFMAAVQGTLAAVAGRGRAPHEVEEEADRDKDKDDQNNKEEAQHEHEKQSHTWFSSSSSSSALPLRFFAPRECARLQGIPDAFQLKIPQEQPFFDAHRATAGEDASSHKHKRGLPSLSEGSIYKLIGNAVNPIVIECLAKALREVFAISAAAAL